MTKKNLFSITILKKNFADLDLADLRNKILELTNFNRNNNHASVKGMLETGVINTFGIEKKIHLWPEASELVKKINDCLFEYWNMLDYHPALTPFINEMWATISYKGAFIPSHFHGPSPINAVFYLDKTSDSGNLILQNPLELILGSQPINFPFNEFLHEEKVSQGDLILFPGYIRHSTKFHMSEEKRISIGMNIGSKGNYLTGQWTR